MYVPALFDEKETAVLHAMIRETRLVTLVTHGAQGLIASHVPMLLDAGRGAKGTLRGHLARANPQGGERAPGTQALAIFLGPEAYISPAWYPTKKEHGKVVPTWNYVAVHAAGPIRFFDDPESLLALVTDLTNKHEGRRSEPWAVSDAPADFIQTLLKAITGFEIEIATLEGKWKMSQNRPAQDKVGVVEGLRREGGPMEAAVAEIVEQRSG